MGLLPYHLLLLPHFSAQQCISSAVPPLSHLCRIWPHSPTRGTGQGWWKKACLSWSTEGGYKLHQFVPPPKFLWLVLACLNVAVFELLQNSKILFSTFQYFFLDSCLGSLLMPNFNEASPSHFMKDGKKAPCRADRSSWNSQNTTFPPMSQSNDPNNTGTFCVYLITGNRTTGLTSWKKHWPESTELL